MKTINDAQDSADAVRRFAAAVDAGARPASRVLARLDGAGGMARLCAVEATVAALWPAGTAKELVWLTRTSAEPGDLLHLSAFAADGEALCDATFRLVAEDA